MCGLVATIRMAKHSFVNRTCIHFIPLYPLLTALFGLTDTGENRQRLKPAEVTAEVIIIIIIIEAFIKRRIPGKTTCSKALQYKGSYKN